MTDEVGLKRTAAQAGLEDAYGYGGTRRQGDARVSSRFEDMVAPLDPLVRNKLKSMVSDSVIMEDDVDSRSVQDLAGFLPSVAVEVLEQFMGANLATVRNKGAFLAGVMNRFRSQGGGPLHGMPGGGVAPSSHGLPPTVAARLEAYYASGQIRRGDLDGRCIDALGDMAPQLAMAALERFAGKDLKSARNPSALFMSTMKAVAEDGIHYAAYQAAQAISAPRPAYAAAAPEYGATQYNPPLATAQPSQPPYNTYTAPTTYGTFPPFSAAAQFSAAPAYTPASQTTAYAAPTQYTASTLYAGAPAPRPAVAVPAYGAVGAASAALTASVAAPAVASAALLQSMVPPGRTHRGLEQQAAGVRVNEFHALSVYAAYVDADAALRLQNMWDDGNELVSLLDDKAWDMLSEMPSHVAVAVIEDVGRKVGEGSVRNVNAYFMSVGKKYFTEYRSGAGYLGGLGAGGGVRGSRGPAIHMLPASLRARAEELVMRNTPVLSMDHFDEGIVENLSRLDEAQAMAVLDEMENNELAGVRNIPAYMMGIIRRYQRGGPRPH